MNKIKLIFFASSISIHSQKWISFFNNKNYEVTWVSFEEFNNSKSKKINYIHIKKPKFFFDWLKIYFNIKKIKNELKPDIVHVHSIGYYGILGILLNCTKKIYTVWGSDLLLNKKNYLKLVFIKRMLKEASLITTDALHIKKLIMDLGIKNNIEIINFGIDVNKFSKSKNKRSIKEKSIVNLISSRNFYPIYNIDMLIKSIKNVSKKIKNFKLYLVGDGPQKNKLKNIVNELNLNDYVIFKGFVKNDELPSILNNMNIYISTSKSDAGIASSTAEAMSCELICVISDVYDNKFWIEDKKSGFLFKSNDITSLTNNILSAIEYLHSNKKRIQKTAREKILKDNNYLIEMNKMNKLIIKLFNANLNEF